MDDSPGRKRGDEPHPNVRRSERNKQKKSKDSASMPIRESPKEPEHNSNTTSPTPANNQPNEREPNLPPEARTAIDQVATEFAKLHMSAHELFMSELQKALDRVRLSPQGHGGPSTDEEPAAVHNKRCEPTVAATRQEKNAQVDDGSVQEPAVAGSDQSTAATASKPSLKQRESQFFTPPPEGDGRTAQATPEGATEEEAKEALVKKETVGNTMPPTPCQTPHRPKSSPPRPPTGVSLPDSQPAPEPTGLSAEAEELRAEGERARARSDEQRKKQKAKEDGVKHKFSQHQKGLDPRPSTVILFRTSGAKITSNRAFDCAAEALCDEKVRVNSKSIDVFAKLTQALTHVGALRPLKILLDNVRELRAEAPPAPTSNRRRSGDMKKDMESEITSTWYGIQKINHESRVGALRLMNQCMALSRQIDEYVDTANYDPAAATEAATDNAGLGDGSAAAREKVLTEAIAAFQRQAKQATKRGQVNSLEHLFKVGRNLTSLVEAFGTGCLPLIMGPFPGANAFGSVATSRFEAVVKVLRDVIGKSLYEDLGRLVADVVFSGQTPTARFRFEDIDTKEWADHDMKHLLRATKSK